MSATASRSLVVVSAGLSQPSSTRLLADRLSAAVDRHLRGAGIEPQIEVIELRHHAKDLVNNLLAGFVRSFRFAKSEAAQNVRQILFAAPQHGHHVRRHGERLRHLAVLTFAANDLAKPLKHVDADRARAAHPKACRFVESASDVWIDRQGG